MPEVKWVPVGGYDTVQGEYFKIPVLTLDQLEAWLKQHTVKGGKNVYPLSYSAGYDDGRQDLMDTLLAQVQAWKEQT